MLTGGAVSGKDTMRQTVGRSLRFGGEESPGSTEARRRVTPGGGNPGDSATESKPPARSRVPIPGEARGQG